MNDYDARLVEIYDDDNPDGPDHEFYRRLTDEIRAQAVLDVGCGTGLLIVSFAQIGRTVVGIDPSKNMISYAPPFRTTTAADAEAMPDLVKRDFTADRPGIKFIGDITYTHTWQGFIYLATVIDRYSKKVVGRAIEDRMRAELVEQALRNAAATNRIEPDAISHSDRGSAYTSASYRALVSR